MTETETATAATSAAYNAVPPPAPMSLKGDLAANWHYFKREWRNYYTAAKLRKEESPVVAAHLWRALGREAGDIAENLAIGDPEDPNLIFTALYDYFEPQKNTIFERYMFNSANQEEHESVDHYLNRLRKLASICNYGAMCDEM